MRQLKFIQNYENAECMAGGDRLVACHIPGDPGICPSEMVSSDDSTFGPSTVFGRSAEQFKSLQSRESSADIQE
jgi:hypothetical protein